MEEVLNYLDEEDLIQNNQKLEGSFNKRSNSLGPMNQQSIHISRNFDVNKYRDKLAKIQSHYKSLNDSKHESFSSSMVKSRPPYNVFVSQRII